MMLAEKFIVKYWQMVCGAPEPVAASTMVMAAGAA